MRVGDFLRIKRQEAGLSLRNLSGLVNVDPAYLSRVERNLVPASETVLEGLASALHINVDELHILSGRLPPTWQGAFHAAPTEAVSLVEQALSRLDTSLLPTTQRNPMAFHGTRVIETEEFPFEHLSEIAEAESWRKEINRPTYHLHKWWAKRLGSVFRALVLGAFSPRGSNLMEMFYQPTRLNGAVVYDPFMGSGTTVGEALKLGARAIGRDINPVAHFAVLNSLRPHSLRKVRAEFDAVLQDVRDDLLQYYRTRIGGSETMVHYYFWVKHLPCPGCSGRVDLFKSYVFSRHAYAKRNPEAKVLCPHCGQINDRRYDVTGMHCDFCSRAFDASQGPARRRNAHCPHCDAEFSIISTFRSFEGPPDERLYAKITFDNDGSRVYSPADEVDHEVYRAAAQALSREDDLFPKVPIEPGNNTNQVLNYDYQYWHQMFNHRQLLVLGKLGRRISSVEERTVRELLLCAFSGLLEFNNMFTSFKGEGTGAVRHMFSHHILKPERTPFETNPLAPKGSGNLEGIFKRRIVRLIQYAADPFEIRPHRVPGGRTKSIKVSGLSVPLGHEAASTFEEFSSRGQVLYLTHGDSSSTDLPAASVDAVVTDPPFFDNVHYSELADFFWVWQRHLKRSGVAQPETTRSDAEVQHHSHEEFAGRLGAVWRECGRVLSPEGLLIFTYHHSRPEGWRALLEALAEGDFGVVACHPIKSELSVASPKQQAKDPIDLDIVVVCRKRERTSQDHPHRPDQVLTDAAEVASRQVSRFNEAGRRLSRNDVLITLTAQLVRHLSWRPKLEGAVESLDSLESAITLKTETIFGCQVVAERAPTVEQLSFA